MRIESLLLTNINSLKGSWFIDFTDPQYCGLFAITGPTGAGKSSILDAIGLSLYGKTPRLESINQSGNELMTRGTAECEAQTTFTAAGVRYRASWKQHRAMRGKAKGAAGKLQSQTVRLEQYLPAAPAQACWDPVATSINEFNRKIVEITGLTYEQFRRSVLLAQGDFAAFLKSDDDSRAQILEQITGTHLYTDISMEVQRLYKDQADLVKQLEDRVNVQPPMEDDTRRELEAAVKMLSARSAETKELQTRLSEFISWHRQIELRESDAKKACQTLEFLAAEQPRMQLLDSKIQAAETAAALQPAFSKRQDLKARTERQSEASVRSGEALSQAQKAHEAACSRQAAAQRRAENEMQRHGALLELLKQVRSLDRDVRAAENVFAAAQDEERKSAAQLDSAQAALQSTRKLSASHLAENEALAKWLSEHAADRTLLDRGEELADAKSRLSAQIKSAEAAKKDVEQKRSALKNLELALARARSAREQHDAQRTKLQSAVLAAQAVLSSLLNGKTLAEHEALRDAAQKKLSQATQAEETFQRLNQAQARASELHAQHGILTEQVAGAKRHAEDLAKVVEELGAQEETLLALTQVLNLADRRKELRDGEPCPLCGALDHPFCVQLPEGTENADSRLREKRRALQRHRKEMSLSEQDLSEKSGRLDELGKSLKQADQEAKSLGEALRSCLGALHLTSPGELASLQTDLNRQLGAITETLRNASRAEEDLNKKRLSEQKLSEQGAAVLQQEAAASASAQAAGTALESALAAESSALQESDRLNSELKSAFASYFSEMPEPLAALGELLERRRLFENQDRLRSEQAHQLAQLQARQSEQEQALKLAQGAHDEALGKLGSAREELGALAAKRKSLFSEKNPDAEEKASKATLDLAVAEREEADRQAANMRAELASRQSAALQDKSRLQELSAELSASEGAWAAALAASPFADESGWRMHLLPEEELRQARTALHNHRVAEQSALEQKKTAESELAQLRAQALTDKSADECNSDLASVNEAGEELNRGMGSALAQLQADDSRRTLLADQMRELEAAKRECGHWEKLNALIGSSDGKKFRSYVQSLTLEQLVILANSALHDFSSRYILVRSTEEKTPLAIDVIDNDLSGARRSAKNLSGGETFIVSLALALGLSRLASRNITIESLFLDEGFSSLDEDSLEKALETLAKLVDGRHLVGLISHVGKIEERIAARIEVKKQPGGVSTLSGPGVSHRS